MAKQEPGQVVRLLQARGGGRRLEAWPHWARRISPVAALLAAVPPSGTPAPSEADERLTLALRAWRRERAQLDGVPAYVVFPDATLAALVAARPLDTAALANVHGFGPSRLQRYGPAILELIRSGR